MAQKVEVIGEVFGGRYKIENQVSEELLGNVYRARDVETDSPVSVKVLHPHLVSDNTRFGRFLREVRATSMVRHVNTIEMVDSGTHHGLHYLVTEFFPSRSLEDELKAHSPMPVIRVAHIAAQVASAIGAAHQESVTHRALSPRNILLLEGTRSGDFVKVRDFGLSKLEKFETDESTKLTELGARVGNTTYMAPEYIDRDRFHPKGDLYALGCMMHTMLTGEPPYTGRAADVLTAHVMGEIPRPSAKRSDCPGWMDDLIVALLAKDPSDRPGAYKLVAHLEEGAGRSLGPAALGRAAKAAATGDSSPSLPIAAIAGVLGVLMLLGGAVVALGLVGVIVFVGWRSSAEAPVPTSSVSVETRSPEPEPVPVAPAPEVGPAAPVPARPRPRPAPTPVPETVEEPVVEPEPIVRPQPVGRTRVQIRANRRALVFVDGNAKGFAPMAVSVVPGVHRVEAMLPGVATSRQERQVTVDADQSVPVTFTF